MNQNDCPDDDDTDGAEAGADRYHVPNLIRALRMVECLARCGESLTQAELTRELKIPKNSVLRIAQTLVDEGYLVRDPESRSYRLSRKFLALGFASLGDESLLEKSLDILRELRDTTRETTLIGILLENEGLVLEQIPGYEPVRFVVEQGTRFPLHTAAPAKAIMAYLPEGERDALMQTIRYERHTDRTIMSAKAFLAELVTARERGYAMDHGEQIEGLLCVAAPVFDHRGYPVAAIWITGPSFRFRPERLEEYGALVAGYARRISARFGHNVL